MSESDRSSIDIDLFDIQPKLTYTVDIHRSKSLVDLLRIFSLYSDAIY